MKKEQKNFANLEKYKKGTLKFAVVGHVEWITFLEVNDFPKAGLITHSKRSFEMPAGGGGVIAKTLREMTTSDVHLFTSLGKDFYGNETKKVYEKMGIQLHVAWRNSPTRKGFSLVDNLGERSITIIGDRLAPSSKDNLNWHLLKEMDGIFITAGDEEIFKKSRLCPTLCTTPRADIKIINNSKVLLDALIGSNLDPDENFSLSDLTNIPKLIIKTEGKDGGLIIPGGRFKAIDNKHPIVDSYGCGDSFAAGIIFGLASKWNIEKTIQLGTVLGCNCSGNFGPYANIQNIFK
tara:strand:+ start:1578 stop:2453 length:876 start_codon:yes stop_codon:yes gene_type:complete